jgi:hypothetical protein
LQQLRDIVVALDLHRMQVQNDSKRQGQHDEQGEASSYRTFELLAEIAVSSAERGTCGTGDMQEILSRGKSCQVPLRRPFFLSMLKAAAILVSRSRATKELIDGLLAEMQRYNISPDQATTGILVDLITEESNQGRGRAADVRWILEHAAAKGPMRATALAPRFAPYEIG